MITNKNRAYWFGASDTYYVMGNWDTATFANWWLEKLGIVRNRLTNRYLEFGNLAEHAIIDAVDPTIQKGHRPIYIPRYRIRVNYDGKKPDYMVEIKTSANPLCSLPKQYIMQAQVLMFAGKKTRCLFYVYQTIPEEYDRPYFLQIDKKRIHMFAVSYDPMFIRCYLNRIRYLKKCLLEQRFANKNEMRNLECESP